MTYFTVKVKLKNEKILYILDYSLFILTGFAGFAEILSLF